MSTPDHPWEQHLPGMPLQPPGLHRRAWLLSLASMTANGARGGLGALGALGALAVQAQAQAQAAQSTGTDVGNRADEDAVAPGRTLRFPRDHGAHPGAAIEWWYATGWLGPADQPGQGQPSHGFQITFFRSRTPVADAPTAQSAGRFSPRQLLFAHAAVTDLGARRHLHAQRIARWSGDEALPEAHALRGDTGLALGPWWLRRDATDGRYRTLVGAPESGFRLALTLEPTQPLLLQGLAGFSQKGPLPQQASHYYSQPQLAVVADLALGGGPSRPLIGKAWLDHEWSHALLARDAVGWDWIGINLHDGGALTAFVLRRADGSALWAGGSHRPASGAVRDFGPSEVQFTPGRRWTSPDTGAAYPVQWQIATPAGRFELRALLDAQELDSRASTGAVYWEGLAELRGAQGARIGLGYLEMTGRAGALKLGG